MKKKIIVLGAHGMLGWKIVNRFKDSKFDLICQVRNLKSKNQLIKRLKLKKNVKFFYYDIEKNKVSNLLKIISQNDIIINCTGKIKPFINDNIQAQINSALKVNSLFPMQLSKIIKKKNIKIYQIATDCVFDGNKGNYNEISDHNPKDVYGKTKSLGEIKEKGFFNIRVSIIGKELDTNNSLVEWFLSNRNKKNVFGFSNHLWNGVTTTVFSEILFTIINKNIKIPNTLHLVPKDKVNKYKLLLLLKKHYKTNNLEVIKKKGTISVNRVLKTLYGKLNEKIWLKSIYKKKLSINEVVSTL